MSKKILKLFLIFVFFSNSIINVETAQNETIAKELTQRKKGNVQTDQTDDSVFVDDFSSTDVNKNKELANGGAVQLLSLLSESLTASVDSSTAVLAPLSDDGSMCSRVECSKYGSCLLCDFGENNCQYGEQIVVNCTTHPKCRNQQSIIGREAFCQYCWQVPETEQECDVVKNCSVNDVRLFRTTCRVAQHVICMGRRSFYKNVRCKWTNGYSWPKAMLYSVTLGGFGIDRFYLGLWKSGIGKLFSFGGLGVWTIVDIVLIAVGYIQPADGSMYI